MELWTLELSPDEHVTMTLVHTLGHAFLAIFRSATERAEFRLTHGLTDRIYNTDLPYGSTVWLVREGLY